MVVVYLFLFIFILLFIIFSPFSLNGLKIISFQVSMEEIVSMPTFRYKFWLFI